MKAKKIKQSTPERRQQDLENALGDIETRKAHDAASIKEMTLKVAYEVKISFDAAKRWVLDKSQTAPHWVALDIIKAIADHPTHSCWQEIMFTKIVDPDSNENIKSEENNKTETWNREKILPQLIDHLFNLEQIQKSQAESEFNNLIQPAIGPTPWKLTLTFAAIALGCGSTGGTAAYFAIMKSTTGAGAASAGLAIIAGLLLLTFLISSSLTIMKLCDHHNTRKNKRLMEKSDGEIIHDVAKEMVALRFFDNVTEAEKRVEEQLKPASSS